MATVINEPVDSSTAEKQTSKESQEVSARVRFAENGVSWPIVFWLCLIHVGALAAPFTFSWTGLILFFVLHWISGGVGVCLGYHRLLTHQSFATYRPMRWFLAWIGGQAGEGPAIQWVSVHRKHHALSDQPGDPHSPHDGTLWSHIIWCIRHESSAEARELHERWSPDLIRDPVLRFLDKTFILWHVVTGLLLYGCGYAVGGASFGISLVTWGLFARLVFVLHSTWLVNSASHMWGYRNYETTDDSRNNWWVALLTYGEGWHNNHHAFPRMARHGHRWWEVDITFLTIWLMKKVGLAWEIVGDQTGRSSVVRTAPAPDNRSNLDSLNRANHRPSLRRSDIQHRERSESGEG